MKTITFDEALHIIKDVTDCSVEGINGKIHRLTDVRDKEFLVIDVPLPSVGECLFVRRETNKEVTVRDNGDIVFRSEIMQDPLVLEYEVEISPLKKASYTA